MKMTDIIDRFSLSDRLIPISEEIDHGSSRILTIDHLGSIETTRIRMMINDDHRLTMIRMTTPRSIQDNDRDDRFRIMTIINDQDDRSLIEIEDDDPEKIRMYRTNGSMMKLVLDQMINDRSDHNGSSRYASLYNKIVEIVINNQL